MTSKDSKADEKLHSSMPELIDFDSKSDNPRSIVEDDSARFAGKMIVITGAGGMLGREGCIFFCKRGARVAALDQDQAGLKDTFLALQTELGHEGRL
jgi:FlaA1/EpsC-like NDP-sugar epimerase